MLHQLCKSHNNPVLGTFEQFSSIYLGKKVLIFLDTRRESKSDIEDKKPTPFQEVNAAFRNF